MYDKRDQRPLMKHLKRALLMVLTLMVILICAGYYMLGYALRPADLEARSRNLQRTMDTLLVRYPEMGPWLDSLSQVQALQETWMTNDRGENLHALYVKAAEPTDRTAVIVHGYTDNALYVMMLGYLYNYLMGYNILLPDLHAHGMSEGGEIQMGWLDRLDVMQWMVYADELFGRPYGGSRMVLHGVSMGAATTMMVSGEVNHGIHQMPFVKCFVEDCGYTSVWDEFRGELKEQFGLPAFPLLHVTSLLCQLEYGWNFREASALKQVSQCTLPMLFIHGDKDDFVPTAMVYPLYEAKPEPKALWIAPGSAHAVAYKDHKKAYTAQVKAFVEKYIPKP